MYQPRIVGHPALLNRQPANCPGASRTLGIARPPGQCRPRMIDAGGRRQPTTLGKRFSNVRPPRPSSALEPLSLIRSMATPLQHAGVIRGTPTRRAETTSSPQLALKGPHRVAVGANPRNSSQTARRKPRQGRNRRAGTRTRRPRDRAKTPQLHTATKTLSRHPLAAVIILALFGWPCIVRFPFTKGAFCPEFIRRIGLACASSTAGTC